MIGWLSRLFGGGSPETPAAAPSAAAAPAPTEPPASVPTATSMVADVDNLYYRWLVQGQHGRANHDAARIILDELVRVAKTPTAGAELVPRVPAVIPQLLRSLRDESQSGADIARLIAQDVVLVAEVIREANSPFYRSTTPIKTLDGAVMLLGQNGLRMLLARVAFRPIINMQTGHFVKRVAPTVWGHAEKCAQAASLLAPGAQAPVFEAYLAGLMQSVGMIVAFRVIDQVHHDEVLPQSDAFCKGLAKAGHYLSARIARLWDFPPSVAEAIRTMHEAQAEALGQVLGLADKLAKLRLLVDAGHVPADDPFITQGLDRATQRIFDKLQNEEA
ncbi:HDOD domain-containing protein [Massilia sp. TS11]|uniref:HDOD domain-containing protein n=1 Tax=Massilia sp. TS11 TaxID=2908003 RepID=UPI001EDB4967|nr:HDOD domain-containing protein [Massilia sp. TS11]MCG2584579.1 HDOD domain-containing protein [Massilia sp. TS11]